VNLDSVSQLIESEFAKCWDDRCPVAYDNYPFKGQGEWVRLTIMPGESFSRSVANGPCLRTVGMVTLQIFTPKDQGVAKSNRHMQAFKEIFEHQRLQGIVFRGSSMVRDGSQESIYMTNVSIPFQWDSHN